MDEDLRNQLNDYYKRLKIYPIGFDCKHKRFCKQFSNLEMTEAKMSMVGSQYGRDFPRIAIISLDPPNDKKGTFKLPENRATEYVTGYHEREDYRCGCDRPNAHWAMTQIIAKDMLVIFDYSAQRGSAVVLESYSGRDIENVSAYFAHVNVAKCCMNNEGKGQAAWQVHQKCGNAFLLKELGILLPEILVSQGKDANQMVGNLFGLIGIEDLLPTTETVQIGEKQILWLPMDHPSRHTAEIRQRWPYYVMAINKWKAVNYNQPSDTVSRGVSQSDLISGDQDLSATQNPTRIITTEVVESQPTPADYGLYKCGVCGKMVMGFEKESHEREKHGEKSAEWKKIK